MRTVCVTLVLSLWGLGVASAQDSSTSNPDAQAAPQTAAQPGLLRAPNIFTQAMDFVSRNSAEYRGAPKDGFYPEFGNLISGEGWISAGPGYRQHFANGRLLVDGSAAISWREYKQGQVRVEAPNLLQNRLTVGAQGKWVDYTQVSYFGLGSNSLQSARSEYRLKDTDVVGYAAYRPVNWLSVGGNFGWLMQPSLENPNGWFDRGFPSVFKRFPQDPGAQHQPPYLHGEVSVTADTRDYPGHPTYGGFYRAAAADYSDRDQGQFSFRRYQAEGMQFIPVVSDTWVVAVHGWTAFTDTSGSNFLPFYLTPSLGGSNTLRGYDDYRFHDRNLLVANAESRWALFSGVDVAAFFDAGNVASRYSDLNLKKTSYGAGIRVHTRTANIVRLDVGHSTEGWLVWFKLSDPFRSSRLKRLADDIPFAP